jgi:hypothetical protein
MGDDDPIIIDEEDFHSFMTDMAVYELLQIVQTLRYVVLELVINLMETRTDLIDKLGGAE